MKLLMIDMDGVLAEISQHESENWENVKNTLGLFLQKKAVEGAIDAVHDLARKFDIYILSTPVWSNPNCWKEKRMWIEEQFGNLLKQKLILTHNKGLIKADFLIDDSTKHGVTNFTGEHIHFGTTKFPNWKSILTYLMDKH